MGEARLRRLTFSFFPIYIPSLLYKQVLLGLSENHLHKKKYENVEYSI